jgi:preprotein translocase subunit SecG
VGYLTAFLNVLIVLICLFLICLILIQRGKGGGLAGAFGGVGGSSAFGTKSGDVFTRVTMWVASVWIVLSLILVILYNQGGDTGAQGFEDASSVSKEVKSKSKGKTTAGGSAKPLEGVPASAPAPSTTPSPSAPGDVPPIPDSPASSKSR